MKILLDTHIYVDWVEQIRLTSDEITALNQLNRKRCIYISSVIFWEIALLAEKNKLERNIKGFSEQELRAWKNDSLETSNVQIIEPSIEDFLKSVYLEKHHKDPFDRLFVAQALEMGAVLLTRDKMLSAYDVKTKTPNQIMSLVNRIQ